MGNFEFNLSRIGLVVDNPKRDLDGLVLLGLELKKRGHHVFLIPMYDQGFEIPALGLDIVVLNYARKANTQYILSYVQAGIKVCILDTEGGVWENDEQFVRSTNHQELAPIIDQYYFWGPRQAEAFKRLTKMNANKLKVTGCPRFDFYHSSWLPALTSVRTYSQKPILMISNFALSHPKFGTATSEIQAMVDAGYTKDYAILRQNEDIRHRKELIQLVHQLIQDFPDRPIVIRTHPFESDTDYREIFKDHPQVEVVCEGTIGSWLKESIVSIHFNSSVSIDAYMMKKPSLIPLWLTSNLTREMAEISFGLSIKTHDYDHLKSIIKKTQIDPKHLSQLEVEAGAEAVLNDWFVTCDGQSYLRVADAITQFAENNLTEFVKKKQKLKTILKNGSKGSRNKIGRADFILKTILGSPLQMTFRSYFLKPDKRKARLSKEIHVENVQHIIECVESVLGSKSKLKAIAASEKHYLFPRYGHSAVTIE